MSLDIGILSTAHLHADLYAEALGEIEAANLVAVADEDDERGEEFAKCYDIAYDSRTAVLDRIDAAVVTAVNTSHREWTAAAADAGVDVLCEKPLATTSADAHAMVEYCEEAGVALGVAMPVRFSEPARRAKVAVDRGKIGELQAIVGTNILVKNTEEGWMTDPERSGGGAIMDHTVHVVDLARWITDEEVSEVYAESGTRFSDTPVEDVIVASMAMEDGTPLTHDGSWRQPESWDFWGDVTLRLIGTEGVIEVDCFDQTLTRTRDTGDAGIDSVYWGTDMNESFLRAFVTAMEAGERPPITGREGLRVVAVIEAAYESAESERPASLSHEH